MEDRLKQLTKSMNSLLSEDKKFTEHQKINIRKAIEKKRNHSSKNYRRWAGHGLGIAVCCLLLFAIGSLIMNGVQTQNSASESGSEESSSQFSKSFESAPAADHDQNPENDSGDTAENESSGESSGSRHFDQSVPNNTEVDKETIEEPILPLDDQLLEVYADFKDSHDQELLRNLEPYEVMKLYWYADTQEDYETEYEMYVQDDKYFVPSKEEFMEGVQSHSASNKDKQEFTDELESVNNMKQYYFDDTTAIVEFQGDLMEYPLSFRLLKNGDGIWTVSFMPIQ
jgi:hypothetical protein